MMNHATPPPRFYASSVPAITVTGILLLLMYQLIAIDVPSVDWTPRRIEPVVMDPLEPPLVMKESREERPEPPEIPPEWTPPVASLDPTITSVIPNQNPSLQPVQERITTGSGGGIVVIFRVAPEYPSRATARGIEGYVDLAFDITASGRTANIRVIAAQPEGVFERASIRALEKWKYKPPMENGVAIGQEDMMTRISFKLDD